MTIALYMDHHVPFAVTSQLRIRGIDVLTAEEDATKRLPDDLLLDRATALNRVLETHDHDFFGESAARLKGGVRFAGIVFVESPASIGDLVESLHLAAEALSPTEMVDWFEHIRPEDLR